MQHWNLYFYLTPFLLTLLLAIFLIISIKFPGRFWFNSPPIPELNSIICRKKGLNFICLKISSFEFPLKMEHIRPLSEAFFLHLIGLLEFTQKSLLSCVLNTANHYFQFCTDFSPLHTPYLTSFDQLFDNWQKRKFFLATSWSTW